jgi:hypothetical protein
MEAHRSESNPRPKGRLTPEQIAKLDRIAEQAKQSPAICQAITEHIENLMVLEVSGLTLDEAQELELKIHPNKQLEAKP